MSLEDLDNIMHEGREYRYLLQAALSLQQRLRALLCALRAALGDQSMSGTLHDAVSTPARTECLLTMEASDHGRLDTLSQIVTASIPVLSQNGDQDCVVPHKHNVPAWLRRVPKGLTKAQWQPERLMAMSPAAHVLYAHACDLGESCKFRRKYLEYGAQQLAIWQQWCRDIRGVDAYGLARLLCETGDLWHYPTVPKLWKRLGVGLCNGERQRRVLHITEAEARAIGFVPRRRAVVYNLQTGLLTQNKACEGHAAQTCSTHPGAYRALYLARKTVEQAKVPEGAPLLWHRRASRYMAKRFLRDLWNAWRRTMPRPVTGEYLSTPSEAAVAKEPPS